MSKTSIHTIDLNFLGNPGAIAAYLIPYSRGAILVECGPMTTLSSLKVGLGSFGFEISDVTDLLLTHIHLDHAGAAGWLAEQGIQVFVQIVGIGLTWHHLLGIIAAYHGCHLLYT